MKFIAVSTGYGKGHYIRRHSPPAKLRGSPEEQADALIELFVRCRKVVAASD